MRYYTFNIHQINLFARKKLLFTIALFLAGGGFAAFAQTTTIEVDNQSCINLGVLFLAGDYGTDQCNNWTGSTTMFLPTGNWPITFPMLGWYTGGPTPFPYSPNDVFHSAWVASPDDNWEVRVSICGPQKVFRPCNCNATGVVSITYIPGALIPANDRILIMDY